MARTEARVLKDRSEAERRLDLARRSRVRAGLMAAARIASSQELANRARERQPERAPSEVEQDSENEPEGETFSRPTPTHIPLASECANGRAG